eukprot:CAMPEP_0184300274 /NCGR_PEP_ID=MMETSP1049-20130417/10720_1 /TAXON_ID=77928 /ORGANISM="Proteomonas sulcata, Strain CCMP704" /LENGTH=185 /DNA_ID=CAMNT_0026610945 /DNA_START=350 /DNA_END=907 /DNA_ORIENTATION=+
MLRGFADSKPPDAPKASAALHFLLKLSESKDGQQMAMKVPEALTIIAQTRSTFLNLGPLRYQCSLAMRNFAFCPEGKLNFINEVEPFEALFSDLEGTTSFAESCHCQAHAANALWAFVYNYQKGKTHLKKAEMLDRVKRVHRDMSTALEACSSHEYTASSAAATSMEMLRSTVRSLDAVLELSDQ